ncbi:hypothetical protein SBA5_450037 [Candidatus Sulfotelmatomonas gaucii]|uniref:Uncharacterized protein n=1 Tax=Candidatus Sulfuritelmatomonas gaucii TaxID=2043161 RepID=A0A2N9LMA1_9BACT|nr:hypothetical protein SBA5_450037 [Candidatus Sulfotelmatomonas gaucii]
MNPGEWDSYSPLDFRKILLRRAGFAPHCPQAQTSVSLGSEAFNVKRDEPGASTHSQTGPMTAVRALLRKAAELVA